MNPSSRLSTRARDLAAPLWRFLRAHAVAVAAAAASAALGAYVLQDALAASDVLAGSRGDPLLVLWSWWWLKEALLGLKNPFFTDVLHHPQGIHLVFQAFSFPDAAAALLLWPFFKPATVYDAVTFLEFVWTGIAAYTLTRRLTPSNAAAFMAALGACLLPYHLLQLQEHRNLASVGFVFAFLALLHDLIEQPAPTWKRGAACGLLLSASALAAWNLLVDALALAGALLWPAIRRPTSLVDGPRRIAFGAALGAFSLSAGPLLIATVLAREPTMVGRPAEFWSADLAGYFSLNACSAWLGSLGKRAVIVGNAWESGCYLGFALLALAAVGAGVHGRARAFLLVGTVALWVSLGPLPRMNGAPLAIPSAWEALKAVAPILQFAGQPVRFSFVAEAAVLFAAVHGAAVLVRLAGARLGRAAAAVAVALPVAVATEMWPLPAQSVRLTEPPIFASWAADPARFAVLDLSGDGLALWHAMHHRKPIVGGVVSRVPRKNELFVQTTPILAAFAGPSRAVKVAERVDPAIDFAFGYGGPPETGPDFFQVTWTGFLAAPTEGEYFLSLASDDGSTLEIDGQLAIDNRGTHPLEEKTASRRLSAGEHPIRVVYQELSGGAGVHLRWSRPGAPPEPVPTSALRAPNGRPGLLGEYARLTGGWPGTPEQGRRALGDLDVRYVVVADSAGRAVARDLELPVESEAEGLAIFRVP